MTLGEQPELSGPVFSSVKGMACYRAQGAQGNDMWYLASSQCCVKDSGCPHYQGGPRRCREASSQFTASLWATTLHTHTHRQMPSVGRCCLVDGFVRCLEFQITISRELGPLTPEARGKGASHSGDCQGL